MTIFGHGKRETGGRFATGPSNSSARSCMGNCRGLPLTEGYCSCAGKDHGILGFGRGGKD